MYHGDGDPFSMCRVPYVIRYPLLLRLLEKEYWIVRTVLVPVQYVAIRPSV